MSTKFYGLEVALKEQGIELVRTDVGDRYVVEEMLRRGCLIGGEQSGHILFLEHQTTGDGIVTALQILAVMKKTGRKLSRLAAGMKRYPQVLVNVTVKERVPIDDLPEVGKAIAAVEKKLGETGRVLVRYSGTEPKVRVMVEGRNGRQIRAAAGKIADLFERTLGSGKAPVGKRGKK